MVSNFDNTCQRVIHQILTEGKANFLRCATKNPATANESVKDINPWLLAHELHSKMLLYAQQKKALLVHDLCYIF